MLGTLLESGPVVSGPRAWIAQHHAYKEW